MKRIISILLCLSLILVASPIAVFSEPEVDAGSVEYSIGEIGGYLAGNIQTMRTMYGERKFYIPRTGHGFAAERGNNLMDVIAGNKSTVVGDNNIKNGADRLIVNRNGQNIWIQDKYYSTASKTVSSAFDNDTGLYRYLDGSGKPMQLEVPKDQYNSSLEEMRIQITEGNVPGVTDPNEAENIVREGKYTYKQAVNLTKAGNIDSLKYDAINGAVIAACSLGITFTLDYVSCRINGLSSEDALASAAKNGLYTGGVVFATYVISNQLIKAGAGQALAPLTNKIASSIVNDMAKALTEMYGIQGATKKTITKAVSTILQNQIITSGVVIVTLSVDDVVNAFKGRISEEQLLKNLTVTIVSVAVGAAASAGGAALGSVVLPGVGAVAGGILGGMVGGAVAGFLTDLAMTKLYYEGDAKQMYAIISEQFQALASDYLITQDEADKIVVELQPRLKDKVLKDMYESEDRTDFAIELMEPIFVDTIKQRAQIVIPTEEEVRASYKASLQGVVLIH